MRRDHTAVSIVVPAYRSASTAAGLMSAINAWASHRQGSTQVVVVDDACPEASAFVFAALPPDGLVELVVLRHESNRGQFGAIQTGLTRATGDVIAVMDADLQDAPADLDPLIQRLATWPGLVCAGRSGQYESPGRMVSASAFRLTRHLLSGRRIPMDAGAFCVMRGSTAREILDVADDGEHLITSAYRAGIVLTSVPVVRKSRGHGASSYTSRLRWRAAGAAILPLTPFRRPAPFRLSSHRTTEVDLHLASVQPQEATMPDTAAHNDYQRTYFTDRALPRMTVQTGPATPYVTRHVDAVVAGAELVPSDVVLDIGCGPGKYTQELFRRGYNVEGLDLTPALIEQLQEALPDVPGYVGDVVSPPQELHGRYDAVVGFMMLHHLQDLTASFQGIRRLVPPGGRVCFLEPNPYYPGFAVQIALTPGMTFEGEGGIYRLTPRRLHEALSAAGFRPQSLRHFGVFPPALANRSLGRQVESVLERFPGWSPYQAFQVICAVVA